nr:MAG TPA: hypothetical protein [Caudoviricetes sp.]
MMCPIWAQFKAPADHRRGLVALTGLSDSPPRRQTAAGCRSWAEAGRMRRDIRR